MTKAQQVYEKVEALIASGVKKAEAFKQVADEVGQPVNSVRGAYYQHTRRENGGGSSPPRKRETTTADALQSAKAVLTRAIEAIDREVELAKQRGDEAQAEYAALRGNAEGRKAEIQKKIAALEA